jgi:hypothetical protein
MEGGGMNIKQSIENRMYSYRPNEFLPVYYDGVLDNGQEFVAYKAEQVAGPLGKAAVVTAFAVAHAAQTIMGHIKE